jgi:ABC-type Na+ efflux pump permease subunit
LAPPLPVPTGATPPRTDLRPNQVEPPFPVRSLLLSFAYVIPLNFVGQALAGTLLAERTRHRALLLFTTPHAPATLLAGRILPYLLAGAGVLVGATLLLGAGWLGLAAALPIVAAMLALAVVVGLLARSPRELTFLLTGLSTFLSIFLFLPAVFTALPPVAYLSPVSAVLDGIEGKATPWGAFLYATMPLALAGGALGALAVGLWHPETLWSSGNLTSRVREGVARWTRRPVGQGVAGLLAVPFTLGLELLVLSLVIPLGLAAAFPAFVVGAALIEEAAKRLVVRSAPRPGWRAGLLVGTGFFVGEKLALLVALAGFADVDLGLPSLRLWGASGGLLLLAGPLVLHTASTALAGIGAHDRPAVRRLWFGVAVLFHLLYNLAVLAFGGGL